MRYRVALAALCAAVAFPVTAAFADICSDLVTDEANVISDPRPVEDAARSLSANGLTVRVLTFADAPALDQRVFEARSHCASWQNDPKNWKSTMLVLAYTPTHNQLGAYFGVANSARFGAGKWQDVLRDRLAPYTKAYAQGDKTAMTSGFIGTLREFQNLTMSASTGSTTIVQAADHSGFVRVLYFFLAIVVLFLLVAVGWRLRANKVALQSAQAEAKRVRALCVSGILEITDSTRRSVLDAKTAGSDGRRSWYKLYVAYGEEAMSTFNQFDSISAGDPNSRILSEYAYRSNQKMYEAIIVGIESARKLARQIESGEEPATPPSHASFLNGAAEAMPNPQVPHPSQPAPAPFNGVQAQPAPQQTTVIVERDTGSGDFLTGMLVGEALESNNRRDLDDSWSRRSDSGSSSWGSGSSDSNLDSGGSYSGGSSGSNDSGGSYSSSDSGSSSSDSGGSFSSSC